MIVKYRAGDADEAAAGLVSDESPYRPGASRTAADATSIEWTLLWSGLAIWAAMLLLAVWRLPYFQHDELAFSEWSRLVANDGGFFFPSTTLLTYQRPLIYVGQGWLWLVMGRSEALGRVFNGSFVVLLLWAVFRVTDYLADRRQAVVAVLVLLNVPALAQSASLALTDIPVAALAGATGALALVVSPGVLQMVTLAAASAGTVLAKPSGAAAIVGLLLLLPFMRRDRGRARLVSTVAPILLGGVVAILYHLWLIERLGLSTQAAASSGSFELPYYLAIAAVKRFQRVFAIGWLGWDLRVPLAFSLVMLVAGGRAAARRDVSAQRWPAAVGALVAIVASVALTPEAESRRGLLEIWAVGLIATAWLAMGLRSQEIDRRQQRTGRLLAIWVAPAFLAWTALAPYTARLLSPIWVPLIVLASSALVAAARGLEGQGHRLLAAAGPCALWLGALLGAAHLARLYPGQWWVLLSTAGQSEHDDAALEVAYGPLARTLRVVADEIGDEGVVLSPSGAFRYFFPGRALQSYPRSCDDLAFADVFVLPAYPEVQDYFRNQLGVSPEPEFWASCEEPRLEPIGADGAYSVFRILR